MAYLIASNFREPIWPSGETGLPSVGFPTSVRTLCSSLNFVVLGHCLNRPFATVLFLNRFGVISPDFGLDVHARHSRQCCDMRCCLGNWTVTALSGIFENEELKKQCLVRLSTYVSGISAELKAVRQANS